MQVVESHLPLPKYLTLIASAKIAQVSLILPLPDQGQGHRSHSKIQVRKIILCRFI